jgi:cytochrome c-type biogenesis protein CcmE
MALPLATKVVLGTALAGALAYLTLSDTGEGILEYVYVEKVVASPQQYAGRTIKVHGVVVEGTIQQKKGTTGDYRFVVEHEGKRLAVHYTNLVPDTFQEGGEVVLTGQLTEGGQLFESDEMSAKCPSKYEEEQAVSREIQQG